VTTPWPIYQWGIDNLCPFPKALGQLIFLIVVSWLFYYMDWSWGSRKC